MKQNSFQEFQKLRKKQGLDQGRGFVGPNKQPPALSSNSTPSVPALQKTISSRADFIKNHPVFAGKHGAERDKFLANHPKINANNNEFINNRNVRANTKSLPALSPTSKVIQKPAVTSLEPQKVSALTRRLKKGFTNVKAK